MRAYIIRRVLLIIPTTLLVTLIVFMAARFIPGDVIEQMVAEMAAEVTAEEVEVTAQWLREELGLDLPIYIQYGRWLGVVPHVDGSFSGLIQGNVGMSLWTQSPIMEEIFQKLPVSMELGLMAITFAVLFALPIGIYSAIRQDTPTDYGGRTVAILCISLPNFWLGTMVIVYPSIWWNWMPALEYIPLATNPMGNILQFLLPAIVLGLSTSGTKMRMTRTMMLEVLRQDYIRTAWSKGLAERTVIMRHVLKNALIPVITVVGLQVPILISGSVVMETIFNLPGMGRYLIEALNKRDYPVISAINLVMAIMVLLLNLVIDLAYGWFDPRVQYK
ncbi:ABC transporter permease [Chloroflexota bacterium]